MDIVDTTIWNSFILANATVYTTSPFALVFIWAVGGTFVLYYFGVFTPSVEAIREVQTNYGRRFGAVNEHAAKPSEHVAGRLPPITMLLTRKMPEHTRRVRSFLEELTHSLRKLWLRVAVEHNLMSFVFAVEHVAVNRRQRLNHDRLWMRMNQGTNVQGRVGLIEDGHALIQKGPTKDEPGASASATPLMRRASSLMTLDEADLKRRAEEAESADVFQADNIALPDFVKNMRLKGLREKIATVDHLLQKHRREARLFGASNGFGDDLAENEHVVYRNKQPVDLPRNPCLDVTKDPVRALRRMLLKLKATSRSIGPTGASAILSAKPQPKNTAQRAATTSAHVASTLRVGRAAPAAAAGTSLFVRRVGTLDGGAMGASGGATAVAAVSAAQEHVLMCELAVLVSWIWDSFWPNGHPLTGLEEEEVNERFQEWAKVVQRQRVAEVFDDGAAADMDEADLDALGDFGTTFNVFAGWFMMLVEYLLKVRLTSHAARHYPSVTTVDDLFYILQVRRIKTAADGDGDGDDDGASSVVEPFYSGEEGSTARLAAIDKRVSLRENFLRRKVVRVFE